MNHEPQRTASPTIRVIDCTMMTRTALTIFPIILLPVYFISMIVFEAIAPAAITSTSFGSSISLFVPLIFTVFVVTLFMPLITSSNIHGDPCKKAPFPDDHPIYSAISPNGPEIPIGESFPNDLSFSEIRPCSDIMRNWIYVLAWSTLLFVIILARFSLESHATLNEMLIIGIIGIFGFTLGMSFLVLTILFTSTLFESFCRAVTRTHITFNLDGIHYARNNHLRTIPFITHPQHPIDPLKPSFTIVQYRKNHTRLFLADQFAPPTSIRIADDLIPIIIELTRITIQEGTKGNAR